MTKKQAESNFIFKEAVPTFCPGIISVQFHTCSVSYSCPLLPLNVHFLVVLDSQAHASVAPPFFLPLQRCTIAPGLQHCYGSVRMSAVLVCCFSGYSINSFMSGTVFHSSISQWEGTKRVFTMCHTLSRQLKYMINLRLTIPI